MTLRQKVLVPLLLSALCSFPAAPAAPEQETAPAAAEPAGFPYIGLVTGSGVNLRAGPGRSYEILLQLARGAQLRVVGRNQTWLAVSLPEGVPAYVHRSFLGEAQQGWAPVRGDRVQVRARPSESATAWGEVSSPDRVLVLGTYGEWVRVGPPPFCRGWVSAEYVTFLQKDQNPPEGIPTWSR